MLPSSNEFLILLQISCNKAVLFNSPVTGLIAILPQIHLAISIRHPLEYYRAPLIKCLMNKIEIN